MLDTLVFDMNELSVTRHFFLLLLDLVTLKRP